MRFGGEKAVAVLRGKPLLIWAADRLRSICGSVGASVRPGSEAEALAKSAGLPTIFDAPADPTGPLAGVKAGLIWAEAHGAKLLAVSPCDAPLLPDDLYSRLLESADGGAAMAETSEGRQPLCALWPVTALPVVAEALAGGAHPPTWEVLVRLGARQVFFEDAAAFANINTREELEAVARD